MSLKKKLYAKENKISVKEKKINVNAFGSSNRIRLLCYIRYQ